jgi:gliding motility-associated lipoprotein GldB
MKKITHLIWFVFLLPILFSCQKNRLKVDISGIDKNIEIVRFDEELFSLPQKDTLNELLKLREKHPDFFDLFTYKIIRVGGIDEVGFPSIMSQFVNDTLIQNLKTLTENEFADFSKMENEINQAFKYFQYHFPEKELPTVYFYISGFNQSVVTAENCIGISLDKYLGKDCSYYKKLSTVPMYKIRNMHKEKIVSDVVYGWGITEFDEMNKPTNLLGNMIYQGKLMYFVDALLPEMNDTLKMGYSEKQLEWCKMNEAQMWLKLVENKMLYSNNRMDIIRYINDGPYTNGFPLESPARTGIWIGWQIIRKYMNEHPEITLEELMQNNNYQGILNDSAYFPD